MVEATRETAGDGRLAADDLWQRSHALQAAVLGRIVDVQRAEEPDSSVNLFAEGLSAILDRLHMLERATHRTVYNMQRNAAFDPFHRERELNLRTRCRKIEGRLIASPARHLSLVAACNPDTFVAPVYVTGLVVDERLALFPGPPSPRGLATAWLCRDPDLVTAFCDIWEETKRRAVSIHDAPGVLRLSERQIDVATLISRGAKDAAIARLLGVSLRTVTADVAKLLDSLGVSSRWEAGMIIGRACPPELSR